MTRFLPYALCLCVGLCDGYTTYYGPQGQLAGSSNTIGGYTSFTGPEGQFAGSANTIGGYTTYYDAQGAQAGYSLKGHLSDAEWLSFLQHHPVDKVKAAHAEIEKLRAALKPFALCNPIERDDDWFVNELRIEYFRAARAAYKGEKND